MKCVHQWRAAEPLPICTKCSKHPTCSPSQISTALGCMRRWAFDRHWRDPSGPAAEYGDRCHDITERWVRDGVAPVRSTCEGRTVTSAIGLLPAPRRALAEQRIDAWLGGVLWSMRLDWIDDYAPGKWVSIGDLKTTGNFSYAKSADELATEDPQGVIYGTWAVVTYRVPLVIGSWVYAMRVTGKKEPPPARRVRWAATREQLAVPFAHYATLGYALAWARLLDPHTLPRNLDYCRAYGRPCSHLARCHGRNPPTQFDIAASALYTLRQ